MTALPTGAIGTGLAVTGVWLFVAALAYHAVRGLG